MIAAATLLGKWTLELPRDNLFSKVFVDDRLLLSHDNEVLLQAFHTTEFWDQRLQFKARAKTIAFGNNMPQDDIWWTDATQVAREKLVVYLGIPLPLRGISSADFLSLLLTNSLRFLTKLQEHDLRTETWPKSWPERLYLLSVTRARLRDPTRLKFPRFEQKSLRQPHRVSVRHWMPMLCSMRKPTFLTHNVP